MANDRKRKRERRDDTFEHFVASRRRALIGFAYALTGDIAIAEEIAADAIARAWVSMRTRELENLDFYIRRIIVNLVVGRRRRLDIDRRYQPSRRDDWRLSATVDAFDIGRVQHEDLMRAVAALPIDLRNVLVMRFLLDMTEHDTATLLGVPNGTVKSRVARGTKRLRAVLQAEPEGLPSAASASFDP